ncbi:TOMM precursor leader peptide-binding protein [Amycolatopsis sp. CA-230715]|uniref:TOMM precursor leader peptide-binding protein n=1 Tax=Amycolatopsis sp. CA-230715 TaxID=2745196 RepID=UPI001C010118|nr:TOMM precursor leader peptide-binding protein [Amycolatopsis sp. CA-230715]QWF78768.1 hypothetical protein HUW46_02166 [Amycolatopsis sp. CA-230715]
MSIEGDLVGFGRHLRPEVVADDAVYLFSEKNVTAVQGGHIERLAPLLDGNRDLAAVLEALSSDAAPEAEAVVAKLVEAGLVTVRQEKRDDDPDPAASAYWEAAGVAVSGGRGVATKRVDLIPLGWSGSLEMLGALRSSGVRANRATGLEGDADLSIVLCEDYVDPELSTVDAEHREARRPWMLAKIVGSEVWLGPFFEPGGTACWHCMATRLWAHRQAEKHVQTVLGHDGPAPRPMATVPPLFSAAGHLLTLEVMKWLAGYRYPGQRGIWTFDSFDLAGTRHEVHRRPQCHACGDPTIQRRLAQAPVRLTSRPRNADTGGGHRALAPSEVLDTYRHLIGGLTGVVKEIRRDTRGPELFNSFRSGPNLAVAAGRLDGLRAMLRAESGGKGVTPLDAEVGALCESLERHSGSFHGDEHRVRASMNSLGDLAVSPDSCQLFDERQYPGRAAWNASHAAFQHVCDPFDPAAELDWTPVWSMTGQRHRYLPTGMLYFGAPREPGSWTVRADSNGNAAGASLEDAILQGSLELVERDAVALWWYNRTRQPAVDLDAFGDPWLAEVRAAHAGLGREVWALDVTSDLGIPAMVAVSRRTGVAEEQIMFGFGAHLNPEVALRRAMTELNQLMPSVLELAKNPAYDCGDPDASAWLREATVAAHPYLLPDPAATPRVPSDYGYRPQDDLADDVRAVHDRVRAAGLEMLVLDQTRPDIGLPVVKVVVPGLRGFWRRLAPGRLFDVPVRLGRLAGPTAYADLNPVPMFL